MEQYVPDSSIFDFDYIDCIDQNKIVRNVCLQTLEFHMLEYMYFIQYTPALKSLKINQ